jgi:mono/diheme cytochrome c family protein
MLAGPPQLAVGKTVLLAYLVTSTSRRRTTMNALKAATAVLGMAALIASAGTLAEGDIELGKQGYEMKCAVCHGTTSKGDGPFVSQLRAGSSDITVLAKNNNGEFPSAQVFSVLDGRTEVQGHGPREMPIWGSVYMSEGPKDQLPKKREEYISQRLHDLVAYIATIQEK